MLACLQIHENEEAGNVLVFLSGQEEIEQLQLLLEENLLSIKSNYNITEYKIIPLYSLLSPEEQLKAFELFDKNIRKFILATNIAETSVTISGIKYG